MGNDAIVRQSRLVYLIRHGDARPGVEDPTRPLTDSGRESVQRIANWAAAAGLEVNRILHSGKLRAEQTAEILARQVRPQQGLASCNGLQPNDDVGYIHDLILTEDGPLMLVGHLPHLGRLVSQLIVGDADRSVVEFEAAAVVTLVQRNDGWRIRWAVQPDVLP